MVKKMFNKEKPDLKLKFAKYSTLSEKLRIMM